MKKDIVERLREASGYALMDNARVTVLEAADEIERLRLAEARLVAGNVALMDAIRRLAEQDATLSAVGGNVIVEMDATLTDAEREAVERAASFADDAAGYCKNPANADAARKQAATLRGLLERLK